MVDARLGPSSPAPAGDAAAALEATALLLGPRARARGVALELDAAAGLPPLALGSDALHQALLNLALNALDASPAGARVRLSARAEAGGALLRVADEGPGLARAGRARSRPGGLGLALTRGLVEAAGGTLAFEPASPRGTCARLWLPAETRRA